MRLDSGVCVKKISWLGWLCWSQTTIYVILSDIVLWSDIFLSSVLSFSLNKTIFHAAAFVFCIIGTTIFAALCSSPTAFASQYVGAETTVFHNTTQHNTSVLYHATLKSIRPPHPAQEADSSRQPCYEQDVKGENIWKISIYPKYLTNIIKRWLRWTNPKIVIRTPADRVHKISTKW